jgi:hypothetical protein
VTITLEDLHGEIVAMRGEIVAMRHELRLTESWLETKIDSKPSLMAMSTAVIVVVFGMFGVVALTIGTLHVIGIIN